MFGLLFHFGSSWDPGIPAQMQHSVYAEDLKTGKSAARPFLMGFPGGPWAPLYMVSFMDPPMLFIMVFELIMAIPF